MDLDLSALIGTVVCAQVYDMMADPGTCQGRRIRIQGNSNCFQDPDTQQEYFAAILSDATACCGVTLSAPQHKGRPGSRNVTIDIGGKGDAFFQQTRLEILNGGGRSGRRLVVQQDAEHEVAEGEIEGHDDLAADASNNQVHFNPMGNAVLADVVFEAVKSATLLEPGWYGILGMGPSGFELDHARHIQQSNRQITQMEAPVEGGLGNGQLLRLDDVVQVLALGDTLGNDAVIFVEGFLGQGNSGAALYQSFPVCLMGKLGQVFMLFQPANALASAVVAHERRFQQIRAGSWILHPGGDDLNVLLDFLGYRRRVFADPSGDALEGYAVEQAVLNLDSIFEVRCLQVLGFLESGMG